MNFSRRCLRNNLACRITLGSGTISSVATKDHEKLQELHAGGFISALASTSVRQSSPCQPVVNPRKSLCNQQVRQVYTMSIDHLMLFMAGAAAGGLINGLAGFGLSMFAMGFWLQIMPPVQAVPIMVVTAVITGFQGAWMVRRAILDHPARLAIFAIPGLIGVPIGISLLASLDPHAIKLTLAGFMLLYGAFFSLRRSLPNFSRPTPLIDGLIGFVSGVLGGATSLSGPLPTMWCALRSWPKAETRGILQAFNIVILTVTALGLFLRGSYTWQVLMQIALALPVTILFAQIGLYLFRHLRDDHFRRLLIFLMFAFGAMLTINELR